MAYTNSRYYTDSTDPHRGMTSIEIYHFSNPNVNYQGVATGVSGVNGNNNARTLRESRHHVAGYRTVSTLPPRVTLISSADNVNVTGTRVVFRWNAADGATRYQLQVRRASDGTIFRNLTLGNVTQRAIANFPANNAQFRWRVRAGNADEWGPWSVFYTLRNPFGAFNHNFNTTNGNYNWIRRPQAIWLLNVNTKLTAGQASLWVSAHRGNVYY